MRQITIFYDIDLPNSKTLLLECDKSGLLTLCICSLICGCFRRCCDCNMSTYVLHLQCTGGNSHPYIYNITYLMHRMGSIFKCWLFAINTVNLDSCQWHSYVMLQTTWTFYLTKNNTFTIFEALIIKDMLCYIQPSIPSIISYALHKYVRMLLWKV